MPHTTSIDRIEALLRAEGFPVVRKHNHLSVRSNPRHTRTQLDKMLEISDRYNGKFSYAGTALIYGRNVNNQG